MHRPSRFKSSYGYGFYQVKLDKESSLLTTLWTPFGRYRYLRIPQGISSAPEEYQHHQKEALAGLNGVEVIADNILCYGSGETMEDALKGYDSSLLNLLDHARSINLKLNKKKSRLRLDRVTYMGHSFTSEGLRPDPMKVEAIITIPRTDDKRAGMCQLSFQMPCLCGKVSNKKHSKPSRI